MMNTELKEQWIAALRSGAFEQHQGSLCSDDRRSFCCLGVLAIVNDPNVDLNENQGDLNPYSPIDGMIGGLSVRGNLVRMNDKERLTFPEIADWVEQNIPALPSQDHAK